MRSSNISLDSSLQSNPKITETNKLSASWGEISSSNYQRTFWSTLIHTPLVTCFYQILLQSHPWTSCNLINLPISRSCIVNRHQVINVSFYNLGCHLYFLNESTHGTRRTGLSQAKYCVLRLGTKSRSRMENNSMTAEKVKILHFKYFTLNISMEEFKQKLCKRAGNYESMVIQITFYGL